MWLDVHTHINMLDDEASAVVQRATEQGVRHMITIGTDGLDNPLVLALAQQFGPTVRCMLGAHPHDSSGLVAADFDFIAANASAPEVVGIGEIGLDYYYQHSEPEVQIPVFEQMLELAATTQMPVEIHTRDAEEDTIRILQKFKGRVRGLIHCFTGTERLARAALDAGFNISISGVVTFGNAEDLRQVVRGLPLDRIHLETDAPFLAPKPHRGKKNRPEWVAHTAQYVAELLKVSSETLAAATWENARVLFPKLQLTEFKL